MSQRSISFLVVCLLMFQAEIPGQVKMGSVNWETIRYSVSPQFGSFYSKMLTKNSAPASKKPVFIIKGPDFKANPSLFTPVSIPRDYYADKSGFVCKREWQLEKITTIPIRFRLGSLDYVNYLEQKPNSLKTVF